MITIKLLYTLLGLLTLLNLITYYTKWSRVVFLCSSLSIQWLLIFFLVFFNNFILNDQFVYCLNLNLNLLGLNWYIVFGLKGISLFFCLLTNILVVMCILINYEKEYAYKNFNLILWILQIVLIFFFTT